MVAVACATAGLIIGAIYLTGIGERFIVLVVALSGGHLMIGLVITMLAALILGMGMPTSAAYILMVALIVPALIKIGVAHLAAHMFAFFFGCLSLITPPVATSSYVAAGIAQSSMTRTAWTSTKLAAAAYIVPFMFVYAPALLLIGPFGEIIMTVITALIGVYALAVSIQGFWNIRLNLVERVLAFSVAILMIFPGWPTDVPGVLLLALLYLWVRFFRRKGIAKA